MTTVTLVIKDDDNQLSVEATSSDISNPKSAANLMAAFMSKYWDIIVASAVQEYQHAVAEASGKLNQRAPLRLVTHDGRATLSVPDPGPAQNEQSPSVAPDSGFDESANAAPLQLAYTPELSAKQFEEASAAIIENVAALVDAGDTVD